MDSSVARVLADLEELGSSEVKAIKAGFAIAPARSHGIFLKDLDAYAKRLGRNDDLALRLWDSSVYEARILVSRLFDPRHVTPELMEQWVAEFDNWEFCDTFCMSFLGKSRHALEKALVWPHYEGEFQRRAGFVLMVAVAFTDKDVSDDVVRGFFPIMDRYADDGRTYVMKGINWALRQVGKRNKVLYGEAIAFAEALLHRESAPARWIARDALRQLRGAKVHFKNYPRALYGNDAV